MIKHKELIRNSIRKNYANIAKNKGGNGCCCSSGCCAGGSAADVEETALTLGYSQEDILNNTPDANMGLGCGNPVAIAELKEGEIVLDLGCGGGFDCFLARRQVGNSGYVIGVDMTPDMISLARENAEDSGYTNVDFRLGEIEHLPVSNQSVDVIISNCVINLSLDKEQVFREAYRVLKPGGRLSISDVVATKVLPAEMKQDIELICGCIGGAEYVDDLKEIIVKTGFINIRMYPKENSGEIINSWTPNKNLGDYIASYIIEAQKGK